MVDKNIFFLNIVWKSSFFHTDITFNYILYYTSQSLILSVPDEGYSRNMLCAQIWSRSTFLFQPIFVWWLYSGGRMTDGIYLTCNKSNTTGATCGAGTAHPSGAPEFTHGFSAVRVARSLVFCVMFLDRCLSFCPVSFGHCIVCSLIYSFWLLLWYLLATVLSVL